MWKNASRHSLGNTPPIRPTSVPASWIVSALTSGRRNCLSIQNERFAYQPLRPETVDAIYRHLGQILPGPVNYFDLTVFADGKSIEELIPNLYRKGKKDKARLFSHLEIQRYPLGNPYLAPLRHHPRTGRTPHRPLAKPREILYQ